MIKKIVKSLGITIFIISLFFAGIFFILTPLLWVDWVYPGIDPVKTLLVWCIWAIFWCIFSITVVIQWKED